MITEAIEDYREFEAIHSDVPEKERSAMWWDNLADLEIRSRELGICCCPPASVARENTYRATAKAIRLEIKTGKPHCACCLKPM